MDAGLRRLHDLADPVLAEGLPRSVRDAIDAALARGGSAATILAIADRAAAHAPLTRAAVEAYLRTRRVG